MVCLLAVICAALLSWAIATHGTPQSDSKVVDWDQITADASSLSLLLDEANDDLAILINQTASLNESQLAERQGIVNNRQFRIQVLTDGLIQNLSIVGNTSSTEIPPQTTSLLSDVRDQLNHNNEQLNALLTELKKALSNGGVTSSNGGETSPGEALSSIFQELTQSMGTLFESATSQQQQLQILSQALTNHGVSQIANFTV
jgi:Killing trait.